MSEITHPVKHEYEFMDLSIQDPDTVLQVLEFTPYNSIKLNLHDKWEIWDEDYQVFKHYEVAEISTWTYAPEHGGGVKTSIGLRRLDGVKKAKQKKGNK